MGAMKKNKSHTLVWGLYSKSEKKLNVLFNEQFGTLSLDSKPS
jgi:hypothetical protein